MKFHYAYEKAKFEEEGSRLWEEYRAAGMEEKSIQQMKEFDWECFLSARRYALHTQSLPCEHINTNDTENIALMRKFKALSTSFDENDFVGRYAWVETVEDKRLAGKLQHLSLDQLELLTYLVV